ncbi:MAG TPA: tRNA (adenosine(37)-N6)-threonylcarbamoyltransferase complex transferase subunit TsaD [Alphaproteobacteria bacterium]|jgi:N6-L-threonylcarbamoyladenine synthase
MIVLGIETSCDETAVAVVNDRRKILSNLVLSQIKEHQAFGGVVPEIAARAHLDHLDTLIKAAMDDAGITFAELDGIAATCGPGLIGGVIVGMMAGKTIAASCKKPFIAVNHLEAHALTPRLSDDVQFPYLLLLVSGGHTQILVAEDVGTYRLWGTTIDDALGECFDKSAKLMGLPYPGGPNLEKFAARCPDVRAAAERFPLPMPMRGRTECDFSFSGLKTAVRTYIEELIAQSAKDVDVAALAASFQNTVAAIMTERCEKAVTRFLKTYGTKNPVLVAAGGVAANKVLRSALTDLCTKHGMSFVAPPSGLCSDNGAMIAWAGIEKLRVGVTDPLDTKARPRWPLDPESDKNRKAA